MWEATASSSIARGLGAQRSFWRLDGVVSPSIGEPFSDKLESFPGFVRTTVRAMEEVIPVRCRVRACRLRQNYTHWLRMLEKCHRMFLLGIPSVDTTFACLTGSARTRSPELY